VTRNGRSITISFRDVYTGFELAVLWHELRPEFREEFERAETEAGVSQDYIEVDATPMAIWLYVCFQRYGRVEETSFYGWAEIVKTYPPLKEDSFVCGLKAAFILAKDLEDEMFEACVLAAMEEKIRAGLQGDVA